MLASQIIDNGYHDSKNMIGGIPDLASPNSLIGVCRRYLGVTMGEEKKQVRSTFIGMSGDDPVTQEQLEYAAGDVSYLYELYQVQAPYIVERGVAHIIKLENKLTPVLVKIEFNGCLVNKVKHAENIANWEKELKKTEEKLDEFIIELSKNYPQIQGGKFANPRRKEELLQLDLFGGDGYVIKNLNVYNVNYSSPKQIDEIFTKVGCPKPTDDNGKVSYGENPVKTYINNHPESPLAKFVSILLEYREYSKLLGTYGSKLFKVLDHRGRLRTSYAQCWTDTGRLASSEVIRDELGLNLANIPKRKDIRSIFIPDAGYSFIDSDMQGQEVIIAGDFSKEPVLMNAFIKKFDHHSYLSSISYSIIFNQEFKIENEDKPFEIGGITYNHKKLRDDHKSCLFAKFYGGGTMRVMNVLNQYLVNHWPPEMRVVKADEISKALNRALPVLTKYLKSKVEECKKKGYIVANKLGRRRYFDKPDEAYGEIMNFPIQASGADCIKISLINIDKWLGEKSKELGIEETDLGFIVMSIYDQNLICLNDKYLNLASEIPKIMTESINYFLEDLSGGSDLNIRKEWSK